MRQVIARRGVAVLGALIVGCGDGTGPDNSGPAGLRVVAGGGAADTILSVLPHALVVELRDEAGRPIEGAEVEFTPERSGSTSPYVSLAPISSPFFQFGALERTDVRGQAAVLVQLGSRVGEARVSVSVPSLGLATSASYTVRIGAPARLEVTPADSMVYSGATYSLRGSVTDRGGNARADAVVVYEVPSTVSTVSVSGSSLRGERIGRGSVVGRAGALADTAWVSVVPRGTIAAYEPPVYTNSAGLVVSQPPRIVLLQLDGSEARVLVEQSPPEIPFGPGDGMQPRWSPSGSEIAYVSGGGLWIVDMQRVSRRVETGSVRLSDEHTPEFGSGGGWIYFTQETSGTQIWRVRSDGSAIELMPADPPRAASPSPAPAAERFVYQTIEGAPDGFSPNLRILDAATGERIPLRVPGRYPKWSPTGEHIAYLDYGGRLRVMRTDGSDRRLLADGITAHPTFTWSPDGQWLLVTRGHSDQPGWPPRPLLTLVNVASGEILPLYSLRTFVQPSWRP